jgi:hemerythrin-like metal-binding protein
MLDGKLFTSPLVLADELNEGHAMMDSCVEAALHALTAGEAEQLDLSLVQLLAVSRTHFLAEEALMRRVAYPQLIDHSEHHQQLLHGLAKLHRVQSPAAKTPDFLQAFSAYLGSWYGAHIERDDAAFAHFLAERGPDRLDFGDSDGVR